MTIHLYNPRGDRIEAHAPGEVISSPVCGLPDCYAQLLWLDKAESVHAGHPACISITIKYFGGVGGNALESTDCTQLLFCCISIAYDDFDGIYLRYEATKGNKYCLPIHYYLRLLVRVDPICVAFRAVNILGRFFIYKNFQRCTM